MRKRLSFLSAVLAASMLIGGSVNAQTQKFNMKDRLMRKAPRTSFVNKKMADETSFSKDPSKISYYEIYGDSLVLATINLFEYAKPGLKSKETYGEVYDGITEYYVDFYKYNDNDIMTENISGYAIDDPTNVEWSTKNTYAHDEIIKDFVIRKESFVNIKDFPEEPEWESDYLSEKTIVRDEKDRILSITRENGWTDSEKSISEKIECEYGEGSYPVNIKLYTKENGELILKEESKDIVWAECNNQITGIDELKDIIIEPNTGRNRISSMNHRIYYGDSFNDYEFRFNFDEKNRTTEKWVKTSDKNGYETSLYIENIEYTDDFGSFKRSIKDGEDINNDRIISEDEVKLNRGYSKTYDEQSNLVKKEEFESTDGESLVLSEGKQYDIVYDDKMRISEIKYWYYDSEIENYVAKDVYEYDDTATGIASVNRENADLKVNGNVVTFGSTDGRYVVCNADGKLVMAGSAADGWVSLEGLPAGLYIVKVNGEAVKVIR